MPFYRRIAFTILATYYTKRGPLIKYVQRSSLYIYLCIKTLDCPIRYLLSQTVDPTNLTGS